ncbi:hypothetical protein ACIB24_07345 [Spongisporangium articulatum]|uniref:Uncharacterized protein n=1 Tax=Spongisporangium articulatum TaxID=3362603 RepID=A0ABW8AKG9_9ACTN
MSSLQLADDGASADLRTFASRARRLDAGAALRLVAAGGVLAVYACALHGGGGPTVLGLRTHALAERADLDVTVPAAAVLDRLALKPAGDVPAVLSVPETSAPQAAWAGVLPPRSGWSFEGLVSPDLLRAAASAGIAEVAAGTPDVAGASAVARLRALVWGRALDGLTVPAGAAFAADAFGFLGGATSEGADAITLHRAGPWWRLSTTRGHILTRASLL